jgi:DNA-binding beta-propeller fold protein YncE
MVMKVIAQATRLMRGRMLGSAASVLVLSLASFPAAQAQPPALQLARTIVLPQVSGKFDHFAFDESGNRLFVAATGNHSVEVIDLNTGKVQQSIAGLGKPHGLAWVAATGSLYVSDGSRAELTAYKGAPLALAGRIALSDDADDMVYDPGSRQLLVGHGGKDAANPAQVAVVYTERFILSANHSVTTHPEGLAVDPASHRVFANIADSNEVAVIDLATKAVTAHWKLTRAADNVPLAFDAEHQILFVACRAPGTLVALDAATGKELASLPAAGGADDLFYDPALSRVYLISGAGEVDIYQVEKTKALHPLGAFKTASGAKTALFVPSQSLLYLGVPSMADRPAEIRVYSTVAP